MAVSFGQVCGSSPRCGDCAREESAAVHLCERKDSRQRKIIVAGFSRSTPKKWTCPACGRAFSEFHIAPRLRKWLAGLSGGASSFHYGGSSDFDRSGSPRARPILRLSPGLSNNLPGGTCTIDEFTRRGRRVSRDSIVLALTIFKGPYRAQFHSLRSHQTDIEDPPCAIFGAVSHLYDYGVVEARSSVRVPGLTAADLAVDPLRQAISHRESPKAMSADARQLQDLGCCRRRNLLRAQSRCSRNRASGNSTGLHGRGTCHHHGTGTVIARTSCRTPPPPGG